VTPGHALARTRQLDSFGLRRRRHDVRNRWSLICDGSGLYLERRGPKVLLGSSHQAFGTNTDAATMFADSPALAEETAFRNGTLQGSYLMLALRALVRLRSRPRRCRIVPRRSSAIQLVDEHRHR
jgi:hypothetical protein